MRGAQLVYGDRARARRAGSRDGPCARVRACTMQPAGVARSACTHALGAGRTVRRDGTYGNGEETGWHGDLYGWSEDTPVICTGGAGLEMGQSDTLLAAV